MALLYLNPSNSSPPKLALWMEYSSADLDKILHPFANFVTNATENKKPLLVTSYVRWTGILKVLVKALGLSREGRAAFFHVVAHCNHGIEFLANGIIHRFRPVTGSINADLPHHLNRLRMNDAQFHTCAF